MRVAPETGHSLNKIDVMKFEKPNKIKYSQNLFSWHAPCYVDKRAVLQGAVHAFSSEPLSGPPGPLFFCEGVIASCH
jgi:hypothetical protein